MPLDASEWPSPDNYTIAIDNLHQLAIPDWLKRGEVERDQVKNIRTYTGAGLYTRTYKLKLEPSVESPSGWWMARCFCATNQGHPPGDIKKRYPQISQFCNDHLLSVSALSNVRYVESALSVPFIDEYTSQTKSIKAVPMALTPFIENTLPLGTYIYLHYQERERMEELCRAWLKMLREMHRASMAHGDLDLTNVLVQEKEGRLYLKLIDYDNMWIQALALLRQPESGHDGFQHPVLLAKKSRPYDATMDRFAALSIYISIRALSFYPDLYKESKADDTHHLLFSPEDYHREIALARSAYLISNPANMGNIARLRNKNNPSLMPYLSDLSYSLANECMPNYNVYDIPPNLGEFAEPQRQTTVAPNIKSSVTTGKVTPPPAPAVRATPPPAAAVRTTPPRLPYQPPRRRRIPAYIIWIAIILVAIILVILAMHGGSAPQHTPQLTPQPTLHNSSWFPLLSALHQSSLHLPTFLERGVL